MKPINNSVADYQEVVFTCPNCFGKGEIFIASYNKKALRDYLENFESLGDRIAVYRDWKRTGYVSCLKCSGRGEIVERF
jgi:DnaJ-class molecular chaperone